MAYPMNYPQYYPQYQPQQVQMPPTQMLPTQMSGTPNVSQNPQNSGIIWVQGETGAKSYLVAPNNTVQLWDSENQIIYLKSADARGMPSMKILDYTIRDGNQPTQTVEYVTREEFSNFEERIKNQLSRMTVRKPERRGNDNE